MLKIYFWNHSPTACAFRGLGGCNCKKRQEVLMKRNMQYLFLVTCLQQNMKIAFVYPLYACFSVWKESTLCRGKINVKMPQIPLPDPWYFQCLSASFHETQNGFMDSTQMSYQLIIRNVSCPSYFPIVWQKAILHLKKKLYGYVAQQKHKHLPY